MAWRGLVGIGVAVALLATLPWIRQALDVPTFYLAFGSLVLFWAAQATSWNILSGYSGYFSFGQGAFFGIGVYTSAVLTVRQGWDFMTTIPVAGIVSALLAVLIGGLAFRLRSLRGEVFALLTLAVPFILAPIARINPSIDGGQGLVLPVPDIPEVIGGFQELAYLLSLAVAGIAVALAYAAQRTRFGWALFAIRDAEEVAEGLGVPTFRHKMLAIVVTGLIAGMAGAVFALQIGYITVEGTFNLTVPLFVIVMSVLGGRLHWLGPALGALLIVTLQDRLAASGFEGYSLIVLGGVLVALVLLAPEGLVPRLRPRLLPVAIVVVAVIGVLAVARVWGTPIDWIAVGMLAGAIVAFWPRRGRSPDEEPVGPEAEPTEEPPSADEALADVPAQPATQGPRGARPIVVCTDVTKRFGGLAALDGVSLTLDEGELVGLVGPNGSGKTTLVNLLSGTYRPSSGTILVDDVDVGRLPAHRIAHVGVARTYQIPRPFHSMTVRDNVAMAIMFGRRARSLADARHDSDEHLALVGLADQAGALPAEINLHERQLLEMARALATRPRVLLLDEALAGLNPVEVDNAVGVVRRIHESGIAIVLVEHLLRVVNQLASRIVVLDHGRTLAEGPPTEVMRDPAVIHAYLGRRGRNNGEDAVPEAPAHA
jgi:branched-chain amino acid transport system permease protein